MIYFTHAHTPSFWGLRGKKEGQKKILKEKLRKKLYHQNKHFF